MINLRIFVHQELDPGCHNWAPSPVRFSMCPRGVCATGSAGYANLGPAGSSLSAPLSWAGGIYQECPLEGRSPQRPARPSHCTFFTVPIGILGADVVPHTYPPYGSPLSHTLSVPVPDAPVLDCVALALPSFGPSSLASFLYTCNTPD